MIELGVEYNGTGIKLQRNRQRILMELGQEYNEIGIRD